MAGSQPTAIAIAAGTLTLVLGVIGYVPLVARASRFERPWLSLLLTALGAICTYTAWRWRCQGRVGTVATLLDNGFYSAALVHAAASTHGGYGVGLAAAHGLMVLGFPARAYALTLPFAAVMAVPVASALALHRPTATVTVILLSTYAMTLLLSFLTGSRRELLRQQARLTQAFGAASRVADESVQAALATTLLSLGHFLHELKNYQTAVAANLSFVQESESLDEGAREALVEALEAQEAEQNLVRDTIASLQRRAKSSDAAFLLQDVIDSAVAEAKAIEVTVSPLDRPFEMTGVADHLHGVLANLIRNSEQADARAVHVEVRLEPSGQAVQLTVHDDGHGVPEEKRPHLFDPFVSTTKPQGTGLGLYLCRRYVEIFGGTIEVADGPLGGAAFLVRLPGRVLSASEVPGDEVADVVARSA